MSLSKSNKSTSDVFLSGCTFGSASSRGSYNLPGLIAGPGFLIKEKLKWSSVIIGTIVGFTNIVH